MYSKNKMNFKLFTKYLFLLVLFSSPIIFSQSIKVKIIQTSDLHGAILPYDFINDRPMNNSLSQVYSFIKSERKNPSQHVLLLDNGDILQGQPIVYYYNFEDTERKHFIAEVMNYIKYDAATIGNHDIETGHGVYDKVREEFNFPWLAANALIEGTDKTYFKPYENFKFCDIKISVLGLITPGIPKWLPQIIWEGIFFDDMVIAAKKWIDKIQNDESPDLIVGLFHSGVDYTYGNAQRDQMFNENASKLIAEQVPGFDIIFTGHDHREWNFFVDNSSGDSVLVIGPRGNASQFTAVDIEFNLSEDKRIISKNISGNVIETNSLTPDENFLKKFEGELYETKNYVSKKIGEITDDISNAESLFGDSKFVDLIHNIQLEITKADISFAAPLSFNASINKGDIFIRDMFKLYRYENLLYTMELSGEEIRNHLEYSYDLWFNQMKDANDNLLNFTKDENGKLKLNDNGRPILANQFYNFDSAEGIYYTVDISKAYGERVKIDSLITGEKFNMSKIYKVAVNSYRGNGGGNHLTEGAKIEKEQLSKRVISSTEKDLRFYMIKWFEAKNIVTPKSNSNWIIIPSQWRDNAMDKEAKLLFH